MATQNINIVISATGATTVVRSLQSIGQAATGALAPLKLLERQLQAITSILAIRQIAEWADEWLAAANKISVFAKSQAESNAILDKLYGVAQNVRQPLGEIVNLYHKLSIQTKELGVSTNQNIAFTEGIGKALAIQGTKASEAKGALLQLSQAMGTGRIKAQEYNSLLSGLPLVLLTVAKNIDAAGGSIAKLTAMQRAGQLSSKQFFDAFEKGLPELNAMFEKTQKTFAQGMTVFENGMIKFLGQLNQASGVSNAFYVAMKFIADNMENIAKAAVVIAAGFAAAFAPAILAAFVTGLQAVLGVLLRISAVLLANPFVLLVTAAVAAYAFGDSLDAGIDGMTTLRDLIVAFGSTIAAMFGEWASFLGTFWDQFKAWAIDAYENITKTTVDATSSWTDSYTGFYDGVGNGLAGFLKGVARTFDAIGGLLMGLMLQMFAIVGGIPGAFEEAFNRAYNVVADIFQDLFNMIIGGINKIRSFMGEESLPLLEMTKQKVDENYFQKWGQDISGAIDEGFKMQGGALEKSLDGIFAKAQMSAKARAAKAVTDANLDATGSAGGAKAGNDKDNPALKHMQGQLKEQERLIKEEQKMMQERAKGLDFLYQNEVITMRDAEMAKRDLIQQQLTFQMSAYDKEEAAVRAYMAQAKKKTEIESANNQLMEISAKRREAQADATSKLTDSEQHLLSVQLQFNNATKEAARNAEIARQSMEFEISMMGKSTLEVQKATAARQIQLELEQRIYELKKKDPEADTSGAREQAMRRTAVVLEQIQRKYEMQRTAVYGIHEALRKYSEEAGNLGAQIEGAVTNAFKGLEDALVDLVTTGKADWKSMVDSWIRDLARVQVKQMLSGLADMALGLGGGTGGVLGGIGSAVNSAGNFVGVGNLVGAGGIASQFASGFSGSASAASAIMDGAELTTAAQMGAMAATVMPYVLGAAAINALTGYHVSQTGSGITATLSAGGIPSGQVGTYNQFDQSSSGILSGGNTTNRSWGVADAGTTNYISTSVQAGTAAIKAWAAAIGLSADEVDGFTKSIEVSLAGLDATQAKAAIDKAIAGFMADMVSSAFGGDLSSVAREGESASATLARLAVDLTSVNRGLDMLGYAALSASVTNAAAAAGLVDAFGGVERMQQVVGTYFETMYSEGERAGFAAQQLKDQFTALGVEMPTTEAGFRTLVSGMDVSTTAGQQLAAAVMALAPAFNQAAASAQAAAANMLSALQNYGTSQEVRDFQVNQIGDAFRNAGIEVDNATIANGTRAQYRAAYENFVAQGNTRAADALMAQQAAFAKLTPAANAAAEAMAGGGGGGGGGGGAAGAANDLASALQNLTDAMFEEVNRIRGIIPGQGAEGYAAARARLFAANDAAGLGDQDAMKALPQLSQAFLALAENNVSSSAELRLIQAQTAAMLENTATGIANRNGLHIPTFAGGGFHDGGWAMVGEMGPELAYLPPAHIYTASDTSGMLSGDGDSATASEMAQMRRENRILLGQVASLLNRQLKLSENWDGNGLPPERETS